MKTKRKSLIIFSFLIYSMGIKAQTVAIYSVNFNNEQVQLKVANNFEKKQLGANKETQLINRLGKKVILRRKALNQK